ncbi:MAG: right-handed parallel beta-helix repeat-containing protein [Pirellulales bacterium]|nr:right-handed parallel beta-helix repeat-containing protein [Pirellulales bacterium]
MLFSTTRSRSSLLPFFLLAICTIYSCCLVQIAVADEAGRQIYVATKGSDAWSGCLADPNAQKTDGPFASLIRARDEIRKMKKNGGLPKGGVTVVIRGGTYELDATLLIEAQDCGEKDRPVIYQAAKGEKVRLSGGRDIPTFEKVTDASTLKRLDPTARGKVVSANLKKLGISDLGSAGSGGLRLFFGGKPMTLARWPNEGFVKIIDVLTNQPVNVRGTKGDRVGKFVYDGDRAKRWVGEKDGWVHGYWFWDWSDQRHKIESIDTKNKVIAVKPPYHTYGYRKGQWYYGMNLLVELDSPGEWYIDRETGVLYFWPPEGTDKATATVPLLGTLVKAEGTSNVAFKDITFEAARGTAVVIRSGNNCTVSNCTLRNLGRMAVSISGGRDCGVENCEAYNLGSGGISLAGGNRKTLDPARHYAVNNCIHDYGQWRRMYSAGIHINGVGNRTANNLIHSAPHIAIIFGGNDHTIELNEIHHVCLESNDAGAIYAGRDWTMRGTVIRNNFMHHVTGFRNHGCVGVYLDDMFSGTEISGNVFYKVTRAAFIGGGRDVTIKNNIFVDCNPALHIDSRALGWAADCANTTMKERLATMPYKDALWTKRYPRLVNILDDEPAAPKGNLIENNLCWGGHWDGIGGGARKYLTLKNNLIVEKDPGFVDAAKMNFRLKPDSTVLKKLPELGKIPFDKIGRK